MRRRQDDPQPGRCRMPSRFSARPRKYRRYRRILPYQGSHVSSLHSQVGGYRPGRSGGLPLAADLHCDRNNRSGRGTPSHHPGQVARGAGRDKATGRLHGILARSRSHRSVAVAWAPLGETPKDTVPGMLLRPDANGEKFRDRSRVAGTPSKLCVPGRQNINWSTDSIAGGVDEQLISAIRASSRKGSVL